MSWSRAFDKPIALPNGRVLKTLSDAGHFVTSLPKAKHDRPQGRHIERPGRLGAQAIEFFLHCADGFEILDLVWQQTLGRPLHEQEDHAVFGELEESIALPVLVVDRAHLIEPMGWYAQIWADPPDLGRPP
jgi:hypothetical protein